jgi:cell pole-organizing protein PopZ
MTQPAKAQEPSMEEILASIRRIIADDDATRPQPATPDPVAPPTVEPPRYDPPPRSAAAVPGAGGLAGSANKQAELDAMLARLSAASEAGSERREQREPDVLDLTEAMATTASPSPMPAAAGFRTIGAEPDVVFEDPSAQRQPTAPYPAAEPPPAESRPSAEPDRALISSSTSAAIDSAFNTLAQTVLVQNARTLEDLVREMLRPMLKTWLDDNLPGLVERLIRAEIERVSRGR